MKKRFFIGIAIFSIAVVMALGIGTISNYLSFFKSFSVTVDNQSDFDIVSVETGLLQTDSKDMYSKTIKSGQKLKIKPELTLSGEGAIYMKFTDSRGKSTQETVCGYTEYLSGYSKVTITNERTIVEQKCY